MLRKYGWLALIATLALVLWLGKPMDNLESGAAAPANESVQKEAKEIPISSPPPSVFSTEKEQNLPDYLPDEARTTLALINSNGPFPHRQDGVVFQNREKRLPRKPRAYYREYTVETPGLKHRGARRIITGGDPIEIYYYTDDHYDSFRKFEVPP